MGIDHGLICWLMDFLTDRLQNVRVNGVLSDVLLSSTGSPQGCVLSPLLFSLYTNECQCHYEGRNIFKCADDSAIVSLSVTMIVNMAQCSRILLCGANVPS